MLSWRRSCACSRRTILGLILKREDRRLIFRRKSLTTRPKFRIWMEVPMMLFTTAMPRPKT
jgi:hypothetical protein